MLLCFEHQDCNSLYNRLQRKLVVLDDIVVSNFGIFEGRRALEKIKQNPL
jgi:hypothetical protein